MYNFSKTEKTVLLKAIAALKITNGREMLLLGKWEWQTVFDKLITKDEKLSLVGYMMLNYGREMLDNRIRDIFKEVFNAPKSPRNDIWCIFDKQYMESKEHKEWVEVYTKWENELIKPYIEQYEQITKRENNIKGEVFY